MEEPLPLKLNFDSKEESLNNIFQSTINLNSSESHQNTINEIYLPGVDFIRFLIEGVGILMMAGIGVVGNIFSVFILSRPQMRSSISCLLVGLGIADILMVVSSVFLVGIPAVFSFNCKDVSTSKLGMITPYIWPVAMTGHMASNLFTLAVTLERFFVICHPLKAKTICTLRRAYYTTSFVTLFSILYNIPKWFEYTYTRTMGEDKILHYIPARTTFAENETYQKYYHGLGYLVMYLVLPISVLIVFNTLIYKAIRKSNKERRTLSPSQQNENSLAVMLIVVVLVYLVCHVLPVGNIVAKIITGNWEIYGFDSFRNFMVVANSSVNFVIYCIFGTKFRTIVVSSLSEMRQSSLSKLGLISDERKSSLSSILEGKFTCTIRREEKKQIEVV